MFRSHCNHQCRQFVNQRREFGRARCVPGAAVFITRQTRRGRRRLIQKSTGLRAKAFYPVDELPETKVLLLFRFLPACPPPEKLRDIRDADVNEQIRHRFAMALN